jgi:hypothetical protein
MRSASSYSSGSAASPAWRRRASSAQASSSDTQARRLWRARRSCCPYPAAAGRGQASAGIALTPTDTRSRRCSKACWRWNCACAAGIAASRTPHIRQGSSRNRRRSAFASSAAGSKRVRRCAPRLPGPSPLAGRRNRLGLALRAASQFARIVAAVAQVDRHAVVHGHAEAHVEQLVQALAEGVPLVQGRAGRQVQPAGGQFVAQRALDRRRQRHPGPAGPSLPPPGRGRSAAGTPADPARRSRSWCAGRSPARSRTAAGRPCRGRDGRRRRFRPRAPRCGARPAAAACVRPRPPPRPGSRTAAPRPPAAPARPRSCRVHRHRGRQRRA